MTATDLARLAAERAEARAQARALEETVSLAGQRGETVEQIGGRVRVTSRDGLQTLLESGALERPEYEAGLLYRRCYETLNAGPRSNLARNFSAPARGFAEAASDGFAELRAFRAEKLRQWEGLMKTGRQVWVLRLVAGEGRTIHSIAKGGSARLVNTRALVGALGEIALERGLRN